ncbi:MAG: nitroreductase family protein, partial [Desulfobacterales bacterium]|nr:nitroreductase family protein [Desulfobacterales bacterium]
MILELLKKRCSIRNFQNKNIPHDIIDLILEAGRLSPSGGNEQSWRFGVITDKQLIFQIAESSYKQSWIKTSPLLIVLCTTIVEDKRGARNIQKRRFPRFAIEIDEMEKELYSYLNLEEH